MAIAFATPLATTHSSSGRPSTSSSTSSSSSLLTSSSSSTTTTTTTSAPNRSSSKPTYIRSGIGGAGNWHKKASAQPPPRSPSTPLPSHGHTFHAANMDTSPTPLLSSNNHHHQTTTTHIKSGIGGFGNIHAVASPAALQRLEEERAARTRRAMAEVQQKRQQEGFRVGIGGAGNFRVRGRRSMGHLGGGGSGGMKRREGDGVVEAGVGVVPRGTGWDAVEGEDEGEEEVWEKGDEGAVYYSDEPLPYGALDVLRRRVERAFARGGREVLATLGEKGRAVQVGGGVGGQGHERRFLRSHRSMWRF
ncbi:hypothetical protein B0J12DRAFT_382617 [Macrophomina phaseolina]|uniref:Uncharacterized protein n=1 Tax=Macrophomina phaseolina TaxID=35725 RepID=A0ABQ8GKY9_9PEZI|nr:hypothetical protein B0J12DRAFT_382617 [Macrophomina phaseolina]